MTFIKKYGRRLLFWSLATFAVLVVVTLLVLGGWYRSITHAPIDPQAATTTDLVSWYLLRDLTRETPATQLALADRFEREFGATSKRLPKFEFSPVVRDSVRRFYSESPEATTTRNSETLLAQTLLRDCNSYYEKKRAGERTTALLTAARETVQRLQWWQEVQSAHCRAIGVEPPTKAEQLQAFDRICDKMQESASPEESENVKQYRKLIRAAVIVGDISAEKNASSTR
ncbi:MAG: hypothetical protein ACRC46_10720 [Thermoguttaceae bacterium]